MLLAVAGGIALALALVMLREPASPSPEAASTGAPGPVSAPSPTASPAPDAMAVEWPGPDSTGVAEGIELTEHAGGTLDEDGLVLEGARVAGDLVLEGDDQTLRDVRVDGKVLVIGDGVVIEDSELGALSVSGAASFRASRVEIFGHAGSDGIHVTSDRGRVTDLTIEDSWIHSPQVTESSHYDGIQVRGVDNMVFRGNHVDLGPHREQFTAAVFLQDANGGNATVVVEGNLINGGGYSLYVGGADITVVDNVFGPDVRWGPVYPSSDPFTEQGNRWADGRPLSLLAALD